MDNIDEKLFYVFNEKEKAPEKCEKIIKTAVKKNKIKHNVDILKKGLATCASVVIVCGCVYAGKVTYEKIWKEPKEYTSYEQRVKDFEDTNKGMDTRVTKEEQKEIIDEEKVKQISYDFMKKFNINDEKIVKVKAYKTIYNQPEKIVYLVQTNSNVNKGITISIDGKTGEVIGFQNNNLLYKEINPDKISTEEARKIAIEIYKKIENKDKDYQLYEIREMPHCMGTISNMTWETKWGKNYDGAYFPLEYNSITFLVKNGNVILNSYGIVKNGVFENNPLVISKEDAIEIAKKKDREITNKEIKNIESKITIQSMNPFIYAQEKSSGEDDGMARKNVSENASIMYEKYETEERYRKIWAVKIEYNEYTPGEMDVKGRVYYVDTTTGEIIGGVWGTLWDTL